MLKSPVNNGFSTFVHYQININTYGFHCFYPTFAVAF